MSRLNAPIDYIAKANEYVSIGNLIDSNNENRFDCFLIVGANKPTWSADPISLQLVTMSTDLVGKIKVIVSGVNPTAFKDNIFIDDNGGVRKLILKGLHVYSTGYMVIRLSNMYLMDIEKTGSSYQPVKLQPVVWSK